MFLPTSPNSSSHYFYIIFLLSLCLLPFATVGGQNSGSVVVTFALPFLVLLSVTIIYNFFNNRGSANYPNNLKFSILCAMLHVFCIFIASLMNPQLPVAFARLMFHLFGLMMFLYITSNSSIIKNAKLVYDRISMILILSGFIMSAYFIGNVLFVLQQNSLEQVLLERATGGLMALPWGVTNTIAACLMMPLFISLDRVLNNKDISKVNSNFTVFIIVIMIIAIIITQSRNAIIALTIGITSIGFLTKNKVSIFLLFIVIGTMLFTAISFFGAELDNIFAARIGDQAGDLEGFNGRTIIWDVAVIYFSAHVLQPVGYFGMLGEVGHTAHNVFLTTLIEQGIFGLVAYVLFLVNNFSFCIRTLSRKHLSLVGRRRTVFYIIAMASILLQLQFEDSNLVGQNIIYQWIFLSLMYLSVYCDLNSSKDLDRHSNPKYLNPSKEVDQRGNLNLS